eukprot:TRINITY_DN2305_c0_g1_i2.p1 TRINITY_DN2305_c0_g1~~TRINITY_DN2305_c0_g1_i2.p1  ORF type:complete len:523 (-),score=201.02 TRINITY_DN2305_c0_g1_i2:395-1885(-)
MTSLIETALNNTQLKCFLCDFNISADNEQTTTTTNDTISSSSSSSSSSSGMFDDAEDESNDEDDGFSFIPEASNGEIIEEMCSHLAEKHNVAIEQKHLIADFCGYLNEWADLVTQNEGKTIAQIIQEDDVGTSSSSSSSSSSSLDDSITEVVLLNDTVTLDREIREGLHQQFLESLIALQEEEKELESACPFCSREITGRDEMFAHLVNRHKFRLGAPDNMIDVNSFMNALRKKLDRLICIYCERTFKNETVLKEHMRKKKHYKIKSDNRDYDRFFISNYAQPGMTWKQYESEDDDGDNVSEAERGNADQEWEEWADEADENALCLFCASRFPTATLTFDHCEADHGFSFSKVSKDLALDFFGKIRLINFIRDQMHQNQCLGCEQVFDSEEEVLGHMSESQHMTVSAEACSDMKYMIPVLEDDALLSGFDDGESEDEEDEVDWADEEEMRRLALLQEREAGGVVLANVGVMMGFEGQEDGVEKEEDGEGEGEFDDA